MGPRLIKFDRHSAVDGVFYSLTFSETVSGLDAQDFSLIQSATSQASIANVTVNGATATVRVNPNAGNETFLLQLNGQSVFDQAGEPMPGGDFVRRYGSLTTIDYPIAAALLDVNGDGRLDLVTEDVEHGPTPVGMSVMLGNGDGTFQNAYQVAAGTYATSKTNPQLIDLNGDGILDRVTNYGFDGEVNQERTGLKVEYGRQSGGFYVEQDIRGITSLHTDPVDLEIADLNGDGLPDLVAVSRKTMAISGGEVSVYVQQAPVVEISTFSGAVKLALNTFGGRYAGSGWASQDRHPRAVGDINGDGRDDIVGFGDDGTFVALAQSQVTSYNNFPYNSPQGAGYVFGTSPNAGGWTSYDKYPRQLADINGDGRADVVGFGDDSVFVAFGNTNGTFGSVTAALNSFGASALGGGWSSNDRFPRQMGT